MDEFEKTIRFRPGNSRYDLINLKLDGETILVYQGSSDGTPASSKTIWIKKGFDIQSVIGKMLENYLRVPCAELTYKDGSAKLKAVTYNGVYVGKNCPILFADKVERFRKKGLDHSIILYGPPGTGKTTFIMSYAELRRKRVLIVGPDVIDAEVDISMFVDVLKPDILLLDDYDRSDDCGFAYSSLPALKSRNPNLMVVITANHPKRLGAAILRPGRGGHLEEFPAPSAEDKAKLLETYLEFYKVDGRNNINPEEIVETLSDQWTHDWIRHLAKMFLVYTTDEERKEFINITNSQLKWFGADKDEDEDEDEDY